MRLQFVLSTGQASILHGTLERRFKFTATCMNAIESNSDILFQNTSCVENITGRELPKQGKKNHAYNQLPAPSQRVTQQRALNAN